MHKILVPVHGSGHALKALQIACDLADKYGVLLHVLAGRRQASKLLALPVANIFGPKLKEVLAAVDDQLAPVPDSVRKAVGEAILKHGAERVTRRGIKVEVLDLESGDPADSILLGHKRVSATTIVMSCRGASKKRSVPHSAAFRTRCSSKPHVPACRSNERPTAEA